MKSGLSRNGEEISGVTYLNQRIQDAMITVKGSIPCDRDYGSNMHVLIDQNVTPDFRMSVYEEMIEVFKNPSNDLDDAILKSVSLTSESDKVEITVRVEYNGGFVEIEGLSYA